MKAREINYVLISKMMLPAVILLCLLVYQMGIKNTIREYSRYTALDDRDFIGSTLSISPAYSATRSAAVRKLYERFLVDTTVWRNELWNQCAVLSQNFSCSVGGYSEPRLLRLTEKLVIVQEVTFNGRFPDLWKLQQELARKPGLGLIGGLTYHRDQRALTTTLKLQLFALSNKGVK